MQQTVERRGQHQMKCARRPTEMSQTSPLKSEQKTFVSQARGRQLQLDELSLSLSLWVSFSPRIEPEYRVTLLVTNLQILKWVSVMLNLLFWFQVLIFSMFAITCIKYLCIILTIALGILLLCKKPRIVLCTNLLSQNLTSFPINPVCLTSNVRQRSWCHSGRWVSSEESSLQLFTPTSHWAKRERVESDDDVPYKTTCWIKSLMSSWFHGGSCSFTFGYRCKAEFWTV